MSKDNIHRLAGEIGYYTKVYTYPSGVCDIVTASRPIFREPGWEDADKWAKPTCSDSSRQRGQDKTADPDDLARSMRRARSKVRRLALANEFTYFVTLTLNQEKVDRYDAKEVIRKLNQWCSNMVKRKGLAYILVPERHKDGAIHFHGFFNAALPVVDSGTISRPGIKKPARPKDETERQAWLAAGGQVVYNLPAWTLGFTTAIPLYGTYSAAVAYVCKYIGKEGDKPAGRWYYSGGNLAEPQVVYGEVGIAELQAQYPDKVFAFDVPGSVVAVCNGITLDSVADLDMKDR